MKEYSIKQIKQLMANPYTLRVTKTNFILQKNLKGIFG